MVGLHKDKFLSITNTKFQGNYTVDKILFLKHNFQLDNIHQQGGEGYPPVTRLPAQTQGIRIPKQFSKQF